MFLCFNCKVYTRKPAVLAFSFKEPFVYFFCVDYSVHWVFSYLYAHKSRMNRLCSRSKESKLKTDYLFQAMKYVCNLFYAEIYNRFHN